MKCVTCGNEYDATQFNGCPTCAKAAADSKLSDTKSTAFEALMQVIFGIFVMVVVAWWMLH